MGRFDDRTVVVTGATSGVGRATARLFAREGADVAVIARGRDRLEATRQEIEGLGRRCSVQPADVADFSAVDAAAENVERELGPIDVWVNNAMAAVLARVAETSAEEFRRVTDVTYLGVVHGTQAALKRMLPRDRGQITQVGSALAFRGIPLQATYCAAKHAVQGFTESLRTELMHDRSGVRLSIVHLPGLNTPQFQQVRTRLDHHPRPVAPVFQPEIAADAIVWASHKGRRETWVGRSTVGTIVGNRLASRLLDLYLARTAVGGQQTGERIDPEQWDDYLYEPVDEDFGAHGIFDDEAQRHSPQLWAIKHKSVLAGAALAAAGAGAAALAGRR